MAMFISFLIAVAALLAATTAQSCGESDVAMRSNRKFDGDGRIVGGAEARPHSHPWIVSIQNYGKHFCGGSLIRVGNSDQSDIVLTAAHCIYDARIFGLTAVLGAHDLTDYKSIYNTSLRAARMTFHDKYSPVTTMNDIAIIKLEKPIAFTKTIQPVCLPVPGEEVAVGTEGTVAGWGHTEEGTKTSQTTLMQVGVPVITHDSCVNAYKNYPKILISKEAMICAAHTDGGMDSCQGDSGGPFVFKNAQGKYVLQGVVSFGIGCAREGLPGVYAKVANYLGWIEQKVNEYSALAPKQG